MKLLLLHKVVDAEVLHLVAAMQGRGHEVVLFDATATGADLKGKQGVSIVSGDVSLPSKSMPDVALMMMPNRSPGHVTDLVGQIGSLGIACVNSAQALAASRDKVRCFCMLAANDLPFPKTMLVMPNSDKMLRRKSQDWVLSALPSPPWILKLPDGDMGQGVMIADSLLALRSMLDAFSVQDRAILVQQCVPEAMTAVILVLVLGGKAIVAIERASSSGEFRSNIALGAQGRMLDLTAELASLAEGAAGIFGLGMAGIDVVWTSSGYLILDVNSCPGLIGPQKIIDDMTVPGAVRADLVSALLDHLECLAANSRTMPAQFVD